MRYAVSLLLAGWLVATALAAFGCKCPRRLGHKAAALDATLLFTGKLVRVSSSHIGFHGDLGRVYKFVPAKVWRGLLSDTITLTNPPFNCPASLRAGQSYVVYTHLGGELDGCDRLISRNVAAESHRLNQLFRRPRYQRLQAI